MFFANTVFRHLYSKAHIQFVFVKSITNFDSKVA